MDQQTVLDIFKFQRGYLSLLLDDVSDERMAQQTGGIVNHPAWQIGHLTMVMDNFTGMLGGKKTLDESWTQRFGPGSKPIGDRKAYPAKRDLLEAFDDRRAALTEAFKRAPAEKLNEPNPVARAAELMPTVGKMLCFIMLTHEGTHLGQLSAWRKAMGMSEALSKMPR